MKVLLDTHMLLWAMADAPMLSRRAAAVIEDERNEIYYSALSVWEIAIKHQIHPEKMLLSAGRFIQYCEMSGFRPLPLRGEQVLELEGLRRAENAPEHKDPFDRMLLCQARAEQMFFLSHDKTLSYYDGSESILDE